MGICNSKNNQFDQIENTKNKKINLLEDTLTYKKLI